MKVYESISRARNVDEYEERMESGREMKQPNFAQSRREGGEDRGERE